MKRFVNLVTLLLIFLPILSGSCKKNESTESNPDETVLAANKKIAIAVVHASSTGLGELLRTLPDSASRVRLIQTYIDSIRFYDDKSGYFYVYNYQCINIAHATQQDLVGKNLYDYQDSRQKYVIRALSSTAKAGGGFVEYYWIKPGETGEKLKIGYVESIRGTNFFIGTGVYITQ
ncbi:MAG: cache domain-containing protein [Bacteroidota bacterium]